MNIQGKEYLYQESMMERGITIVVSPSSSSKSKAINNKKRRELIEQK